MHRSILIFAAMATLVVTGFVLYGVRCSRTRANHGSKVEMRDPLASDAGLSFRQSRPTHWRDVMMR